MKQSGATETVQLNRVLIAPRIAHHLLTESHLCNARYTVTYTREDLIVKNEDTDIGAGKRMGRLYTVGFQTSASDQAFHAPGKEKHLDIGQAGLAHANCCMIKWMTTKNTV